MQRNWSSAISAAVIVLQLLCAGYLRAEELLYDVTFDEPEHTVGNPPAIGFGPAPRKTPTATSVGFGPDTNAEYVVASFLSMDHPLEMRVFDPVQGDIFLGGPQLLFDLSDPELSEYLVYRASFDIAFESFANSPNGASVFFDAPGIHRLTFKADGSVTTYSVASQSEVTIGNYAINHVIPVDVYFDKANSTWRVRLDGVQAFEGPAQYFSSLGF